MEETISLLRRVVTLMCLQKKVLTLPETAELMGVSKQHLYTLTGSKKIPYYRQGKFIYFRRDQIEQYLLQNPVACNEAIENQTFKILNNQNSKITAR